MLNILCSVCTETLFGDDHVSATACCHVFHEKCLTDWIERSKTCPECRSNCSVVETRRLFFSYDPSLEVSEETDRTKSLELEVQKLSQQLVSLKLKYEEQLCVENEIRREMHKTIKNLKQSLKDSKSLNQPKNLEAVTSAPGSASTTPIPTLVPSNHPMEITSINLTDEDQPRPSSSGSTIPFIVENSESTNCPKRPTMPSMRKRRNDIDYIDSEDL